jgi:hypothetical protein
MNSKESKNIYSFNFETMTAYINDEPLGTIVDYTDTILNVVWDNGMKQEFRLYQQIKNFINES